MITVLAGGVGAARFLTGLMEVCPPEQITAVVNTGDDVVLHGLHVSPDLDTVTYTLAGAINPETGWGLAGETWGAMDALARFEPVRPEASTAAATWFRLGDRDLGTHLYRTHRLSEGASMSEVTAEVTSAFGLAVRLLPMSDQRVETRVTIEGEGEVGFQEYFVQRRHDVPITGVRFAGAEDALPAPGVLDALEQAETIVIAPSNPLVSIAPILAVPGVRDAVAARREHVVAVSPIIAGAALKGPADRMLAELGHERSAAGVARLYAGLAGSFVLDEADRALAGVVEASGLRAVVAPTIMRARAEAAALARVTVTAAA